MATKRYHVPPANQGQIVEVAYQQVGGVLLRRTTDRSDRSVGYAMIDLDDDEVTAIDPDNTEPDVSGEWTTITADMAQQIADEGP